MFIFHSILNNIYSKQHKDSIIHLQSEITSSFDMRDEKLFGVIATSFLA